MSSVGFAGFALRAASIDPEIRDAADFIAIKRHGWRGLPEEIGFLYRYIPLRSHILQRLPPSASIHRAALWVSRGKVRFYVAQNKGNGSLYNYGVYRKIIEVPSVDVNGYLPCDILKLDVEGSEYEILEHAELSKVRRGVAVEFHKHRPGPGMGLHDVLHPLRNAGFRVDYVKEYQLSGYLHASKE